jgi:hypothetical protein
MLTCAEKIAILLRPKRFRELGTVTKKLTTSAEERSCGSFGASSSTSRPSFPYLRFFCNHCGGRLKEKKRKGKGQSWKFLKKENLLMYNSKRMGRCTFWWLFVSFCCFFVAFFFGTHKCNT